LKIHCILCAVIPISMLFFAAAAAADVAAAAVAAAAWNNKHTRPENCCLLLGCPSLWHETSSFEPNVVSAG
jgi:hypothetical protein